jgi:hypothetical protein
MLDINNNPNLLGSIHAPDLIWYMWFSLRGAMAVLQSETLKGCLVTCHLRRPISYLSWYLECKWEYLKKIPFWNNVLKLL